MKLNKAEQMLKKLDKKVSGKLSTEPMGSVNKSFSEQLAYKNLDSLIVRCKKEGIQ